MFGNVLETTEKKFDIHSFVLSAFAFGGITLGVGNIGTYPFISLPPLLPIYDKPLLYYPLTVLLSLIHI